MRRWVGIDEAGYGPNLGPLVMTAVIAEDPCEHPSYHGCPDIWKDLHPKVVRAGGESHRLWIDDSKAVYRGGKGRDRLDAACSLVVEATGESAPASMYRLFRSLKAGALVDCELDRWLPPGTHDWPWPCASSNEMLARLRPDLPLSPVGSSWKLAEVRTVVVGPAAFNAALARHGSKAGVHFEAFSRLLRPVWDLTAEGDCTGLSCDKHGGRHFYFEPLRGVFAEEWIERGPEGPTQSRYRVRGGGRTLELNFAPRADAGNGLVALASLVSKAVRESWMDAFNQYWKDRIPDLKPTAGYPNDAWRFRRQVEGLAIELGLESREWWREK